MVARTGRPVSECSKDYMLRVRMCEKDIEMLDFLCSLKNKSRSELIRLIVQEQYNNAVEK